MHIGKLDIAAFVYDFCRTVHRQTDLSVELEGIGLMIELGIICGYVQRRTGWLWSILD